MKIVSIILAFTILLGVTHSIKVDP